MKKIFFILAALCLFGAVSCQDGDGAKDYGNALVYITQAMTNSTIDNVYAVPAGDAEYTYNFKIEEDVVKVYLSVYRSGKLSGTGAVTVDVVVDAQASAEQAESLGAEVMPEEMYSLPSTATVPAGQNATTFYLELQQSALQASDAAGKIYVLCVNIENPTRYELYEDACQVIVELDVDAMNAYL